MQNQRFSVSADELKTECLRRKYIQLLSQAEVFPSEENWKFIISNKLPGLAKLLYRKYLVSVMMHPDHRCDFHMLALNMFPQYIKSIDRSEAIDAIYSDSYSDSGAFVKLVRECDLFDAEYIGTLVGNGHVGLAAELLDAYQLEYDGDSIDAMQYLRDKFENLPSVGSIELHKGVFRNEQRYICPCGHSNPGDTIYCRHEDCGLDIKGLTALQRDKVSQFSERIEILREMLD